MAAETDPGDVDSPEAGDVDSPEAQDAEARDSLSPLPGGAVARPRRPRLIILMGGPGSGKGTIGSMLVEELRGEGWQCAHVSVGTLLRARVARHRQQPLRQSARNFFRGDAASSPTIATREKGDRGGKMLRRAPSLAAKQLGAVAKHMEDQEDGGQEDGGVSVAEEVAAAMAAGRPVGSELVLRVILDGIREYGPHQTLLLDGFPLNLAQAGLMEAAPELGMPDGVILLRCPENSMIQRVLARNVDGCAVRQDDRNMSVLARIKNFSESLLPIMERYRPIFRFADTGGSLQESFESVKQALAAVQPGDSAKLGHLGPAVGGGMQGEGAVRALFEQVDADNSGYLDAREVQALCTQLHLPVTRTELLTAMRQMDRDCSGTVEWPEFRRWFEAFKKVRKSHRKADATKPADTQQIEFQVWMHGHKLGDFVSALRIEGFVTFDALQALGPTALVDLLDSMAVDEEQALPLLEHLQGRSNGFDDWVAAARRGFNHSDDMPVATVKKGKRSRQRQQSRPELPHYAQPHLSAMLPDFVNAGAEHAQAVWGMRARSTADALQEHKSSRHTLAHPSVDKNPRLSSSQVRPMLEEHGTHSRGHGSPGSPGSPATGLVLPQLTPSPTSPLHGTQSRWQARWHTQCDDGREWVSAGKLERTGVSPPPQRDATRLLVLSQLKRKHLQQLYDACYGARASKRLTSAAMIATLASMTDFPPAFRDRWIALTRTPIDVAAPELTPELTPAVQSTLYADDRVEAHRKLYGDTARDRARLRRDKPVIRIAGAGRMVENGGDAITVEFQSELAAAKKRAAVKRLAAMKQTDLWQQRKDQEQAASAALLLPPHIAATLESPIIKAMKHLHAAEQGERLAEKERERRRVAQRRANKLQLRTEKQRQWAPGA